MDGVKINGREYQFNRPTMKLLKQVLKVEEKLDSDKLTPETVDEEKSWEQLEKTWDEYVRLVVVNPDANLRYGEMTPGEVADLRISFTNLAMRTTVKSPAGLATSQTSK